MTTKATVQECDTDDEAGSAPPATFHPLRLPLAALSAFLLLMFSGLALAPSASAQPGSFPVFPGQMCSLWNPVTIEKVTLASGELCSTLTGDGAYVESVSGTFASDQPICDWEVTAELFDDNWNWHTTYTSGRDTGCLMAGAAGVYLGNVLPVLSVSTMPENGWICSSLRSSGQRVTSNCFYIHP